MKTLQITAPFQMRVADTEKPQCGNGEVMIRVMYAGFCGSDLNTYRGNNAMSQMPVTPGHEIGAVMEEEGTGVPETLQKGMTVTVNPYTNCGVCPSCRNRRYNACQHNETLGVQRNGAMSEYFVLPWQKVIPVEGISVRDCALIEPMSVGFHAVSRAQVVDTDTVMVIGCGMVGVGAVVRALTRGATVIACDIDDKKLDVMRSIGAHHVINSMTEDVHQRLSDITGGMMPDVIIEAVGSPVTYNTAVNEVAFTGRVVCIGYSKNDVSFTTKYFVQKELDIRGSRNALPEDFEGVIKYMRKGTCPYDTLISGIVSPEEAAGAMAQWHEHPGDVFRLLVKF